MAYADPQSVTISGTPVSLPRTGSGPNAGTFTSADGLVRMTVSHAYGRRNRRTIRLEHAKVAPDPFVPSQNARYSMSTYIVIDTPTTGYTAGDAKAIVDALTAYLTASTGANVTKLLGGEN